MLGGGGRVPGSVVSLWMPYGSVASLSVHGVPMGVPISLWCPHGSMVSLWMPYGSVAALSVHGVPMGVPIGLWSLWIRGVPMGPYTLTQ